MAHTLRAVVGCALVVTIFSACEKTTTRRGDLALSGGSPTIRREFTPRADDPATTNDESNDQPLTFFGTVTVQVTNVNSGNSYPLDADLDGTTLNRLYFQKGGWIDFPSCELDSDLFGSCTDEQGRDWEIEGATTSPAATASADDEDEDDEDREREDSGEENPD